MRMAGVQVDPITLTSNLDKPVAETALIALSELADASRYDLAELPGGFAQGRIAMQRQHPGMFVTALNQNSDIANDYALFASAMPHVTAGGSRIHKRFGHIGSSKNKDLAWKFIALLYRDDILLEAQVLSGFMAGRLDMVTRMTQAIHLKSAYSTPCLNTCRHR